MILWWATLGISLLLPILGILALVACVFMGWPKLATGLLIAGAVYLFCAYWPVLNPRIPPKATGVSRIVFLNVRIEGPDRKAQVRALLKQDADVIALAEADSGWLQHVKDAGFDAFPHRVLHRIGKRRGRIVYDDHIMLISRWPLVPLEAREGDDDGLALYHVEAPVPFVLFVVHPMAPLFAQAVPLRNTFLQDMARFDYPERTLIVGDFNTVPWDPAMVPLWARKDLKTYFSWLPTYRRDVPGVPIDHVMATFDMPIKAVTRWSDAQSDHLGLRIDLRL